LAFIKKIRLQNFQSHKDTTIEFDPGLTVILGQTDQGKSAIIRALKWVLYNEPRGTDFITAGCNSCRVTLEMSNGTLITRERDGQINRYILKENDSKHVFEGFGNTIPLEIIKAHGIPKVHIDVDSITAVNLAEQLEGPFLISESGSKRAKALGKLAGIHVIDAAQRTVIKDITDAEHQRRLLSSEKNARKQELEKYKDLHLTEKRISELKLLIVDLKQKKTLLKKLIKIKESLLPTEKEIKEIEKTLARINFLSKAEENISLMGLLWHDYEYLSNLQDRISENCSAINNSSSILKKLAYIDEAKRFISDATLCCEKMKSLSILRKKIRDTDITLKLTNQLLKDTQDVLIADNFIEELYVLKEKLDIFSSYKNQSETLEEKLKYQNKLLRDYNSIICSNLYLENAKKSIDHVAKLNRINEDLKKTNSALKKGEDYILNITKSLQIMVTDYCLLLKKLSKCPTCLHPIDANKADKIAWQIINI
jgi:exonuclease SbcC